MKKKLAITLITFLLLIFFINNLYAQQLDNNNLTQDIVSNHSDLIEEETQEEGWDTYFKNILEENFYSNPLIAILITFLAGLLTFYLPCTYPLVPLTISYLGSKETKNIFDSFINSVIYVLGMAVIYSILGLIAVLLGSAFGSIAFSPYILMPLILLFSYFMFSMFGYYEIQLPSFLQKFKSSSVGKTKSKGGIFIFGIAAGLVVTPCALPVIATILTLIAQASGTASVSMANLLYGMFLMFIFALGLGIFFIILGTFSGLIKKLPKSGKWLVGIQKFFGILMLVVIVFYIQILFTQLGLIRTNAILYSIGIMITIMGILLLQDKSTKEKNIKNSIYMLFSVILLTSGIILQTLYVFVLSNNITFTFKLVTGVSGIILAIILYLIDLSKSKYPKIRYLFKGISALLITISMTYFLSIALSSFNIIVFEKLEEKQEEIIETVNYIEYDEAIKLSRKDAKLIFIDFWATWCVNCLEFEHFAESNKSMQKFLSNFHVVKINYDQNLDLAKKFDVISLPNFIIIDSDENIIHREYGFADVDEFLNRLKSALIEYIE